MTSTTSRVWPPWPPQPPWTSIYKKKNTQFLERLPAAATAAIAALFIGRVRPPQPQEYDHHDLHNLHELHKTKCALDKLRFELTLYGFFSKQKCDLIVSIVWRSWRSWRSRWCQRWFAWRLTTSDIILTSIWTSTTSRQWRQYDLFFVSRKKSVQCKLRSFRPYLNFCPVAYS